MTVGKREQRMRLTDLAQCTRKQLLAIAKQHGLKGVSRLRKQELFDYLRQALSPLPLSPLSSPPLESESVEPSAQTREPAVSVSQPLTAQLMSAEPLQAPLLSTMEEFTISTSQPFSTQLSPAEPPIDFIPPDFTPPATDSSAGQSEQNAVDSKFFSGAQSLDNGGETEVLPTSYSDNRIVLLARDPHGVYAYWDFSDEHWTQAQNQRAADDDRLVLRVFDVTYVEFTGANAWSSIDVELTPYATSWYVAVPRSDASYCAEIGYQSRSGRFISLGRSNVVTTPRLEESPSTTVRWLTPPERRAAEQQDRATFLSALPGKYPARTLPTRSVLHLPSPSSAEYPSSWGNPHRS